MYVTLYEFTSKPLLFNWPVKLWYIKYLNNSYKNQTGGANPKVRVANLYNLNITNKGC